MRYFSMFSGIGGFELGIKRAYNNQYAHISKESRQEECKQGRFRNTEKSRTLLYPRNNSSLCVGYSEIDKHAIATFESHFPNIKNYGDATKINTDELPDFDMLCGGFPCQSFSIAGKRKGFQDTRGTLFHEILRIAKAKRPRLLLLENVKGLLSADDGRCFATIITSLDELGYDVEWQVLNSKYFGVPQNRERVFIIGHLRGEPFKQVFPIGQISSETKGMESEEKMIANTLDANYFKGNSSSKGRHTPRTEIIYSQKSDSEIARIYDTDGIAPTLHLKTGGWQEPKISVIPVLTPMRPDKRQNGRRFKDDGEEMFTLTGQDQHRIMMRDGRDNRSCLRSGRTSEVGIAGQSIRRLTPTECERLQGFPDSWTIGSDTQRYKQCGNAVTVNVIESIIQQMNDGGKLFSFGGYNSD